MEMTNPFHYDYFIEKRRNNENQLKSIYNFIQTGTNNLQKATWEIQSGKTIETNQFKQKQKDFDDQHMRFLDMRRKKLSELLSGEENNYRVEIIQNQETPEQVRQKMEAKLIALKTQREKERIEHVNKLQEKRFYDSADQLRKNESETFAYSCYLEQENQMLDKLKKREKEKRQEEVYVKLNEFDNMKKIEKEKQQELEKKDKIKRTFDYLKWQKEEQDEALRKQEHINDVERDRMREQWKRDEQNENDEKQNRLLSNIAVYRDIEDFNKKEEEQRQKKHDFEKAKDKELINDIVEKEKALDMLDKQEKERKIKEFHQNKKYLEYIMGQKKEAEAWMDKLAQEEADRQFKKTQEQWMKEEAKRIELLKNVYREREKSVLYKMNVREEEKNQIAKERAVLDEEIRRYNERLEEIRKQEALRRKAHQSELVYQISEKDHHRRRELQDKLYEERAAQLWEMEYQKKINQQKEIHLQKLAEIKNRNNA